MGKRQRRRMREWRRREARRGRELEQDRLRVLRTMTIDKRVVYGLVVATCLGYALAVWGALSC